MAPKHALLSSSGSGGSGVGGVNTKRDSRASSAVAWVLDTGMVAVCSPRTRALDGKLARWLVTAVLVLMLQSTMAADGRQRSSSSVNSQDLLVRVTMGTDLQQVRPQLSPHCNMLSSICRAQQRLALHRSARLHPALPSSVPL
ncbi:hypothetical protein JOQ06_002558 [Pogonophryne albipinna]|uniref:Uncharacterized protein n=1 Tax=Pogonophryne albipinna TaxID=1090488 RepID=A0AAD6B803_9TELE|nr:hypothetical protein JOQ06_002558 [Pogonophryne albipinna]